MSSSSSDSEDSETTFFSLEIENEPITRPGQIDNMVSADACPIIDDSGNSMPYQDGTTCLDYLTAWCYSISIVSITGVIVYVIFKLSKI